MRNVLEELKKNHHADRKPTILGLREHIFTGSVSSLAWFKSNQETSFVTIGLALGGLNKASRVINLSEDIFAGKGRDVGMNQISLFEAKVANGNGDQTLSRDVYRLGRRSDFYRMLSYFTTVGFYFSSMVTVLTVYLFLYGSLYMVMSGVEREILDTASVH
ncbi:callose synthase 7 [Cucumis melo var. makuwa]|uniref:Callose synthase 7 n=1 Tax=Cucumis melo var. makuwa TaxID=1194695 RepID=A0A5D3DT48_CUCMM|nr:callose synthase 7 [Cucumis melo var. makuwa]